MTSWLYPWERRFWLKVYRRGDCWEWRGPRAPRDYGRFMIHDGATITAHRMAYELAKGPIPAGLHIHHICEHTWCVRPSHLLAVTMHEHIVKLSKTVFRRNAEATHCKYGHPFTGENLRLRRNGHGRICLACVARRSKEAWERLRRARAS